MAVGWRRVGSGRVGVIISSRRIVLVSVVRLLFGVVRREKMGSTMGRGRAVKSVSNSSSSRIQPPGLNDHIVERALGRRWWSVDDVFHQREGGRQQQAASSHTTTQTTHPSLLLHDGMGIMLARVNIKKEEEEEDEVIHHRPYINTHKKRQGKA